MNGQPPAVFVVGFGAEQVEKLRHDHRCYKVKGGVGVAGDDKERRFSVAQGVKLQFVALHQLPQLLDVKGCKPRAAGNEDRGTGLARRQQKFFVLLDRKMLRVFFLQAFKHEVNGALKLAVILAGFACVDHFKQRRKVSLCVRGFVVNVAD